MLRLHPINLHYRYLEIHSKYVLGQPIRMQAEVEIEGLFYIFDYLLTNPHNERSCFRHVWI